MVDPLSVVGTILAAVQLIGSAASTVSQNKCKCLELAERTKTLDEILPYFAHAAAANDTATARVLERLRVAVDDALRLIQSCQSARIFSKAAELDSVDKRINSCIMDLTLIRQAPRITTSASTVTAPGSVPAQAYVQAEGSYYQAQGGGASTAHVAWPAPPPSYVQAEGSYYQAQGGGASAAHVAWPAPPPPWPQHAWSASHSQGYYYQQPPGYAQWVPGPAPYPASPAPSGYNLSSLYTLPTVKKAFDRLFR